MWKINGEAVKKKKKNNEIIRSFYFTWEHAYFLVNRVPKHWYRCPRKMVDAPSPSVFEEHSENGLRKHTLTFGQTSYPLSGNDLNIICSWILDKETVLPKTCCCFELAFAFELMSICKVKALAPRRASMLYKSCLFGNEFFSDLHRTWPISMPASYSDRKLIYAIWRQCISWGNQQRKNSETSIRWAQRDF